MSTLTPIPDINADTTAIPTSETLLQEILLKNTISYKETQKRKEESHTALIGSLPKDYIEKDEIKLEGKYLVFSTGYCSRIGRDIPFTLCEYNSKESRFIPSIPAENADTETEYDDDLECCDGDPRECPHQSILCLIDNLWGLGLYLSKLYFNKSKAEQVKVSADIAMIMSSYPAKSLCGIVIFEDKMPVIPEETVVIDPTLHDEPHSAVVQDVITDETDEKPHPEEPVDISLNSAEEIEHIRIYEAYEVLENLKYCRMFRILSEKVVILNNGRTGNRFQYIHIDVDSESDIPDTAFSEGIIPINSSTKPPIQSTEVEDITQKEIEPPWTIHNYNPEYKESGVTSTKSHDLKIDCDISSYDMVLLCEKLEAEFNIAYDTTVFRFAPEATKTGGIVYSHFPGKKQKMYKSIGICVNSNAHKDSWPRIPKDVMTVWKTEKPKKLVSKGRVITTWLNANHESPVWEPKELQIFKDCFRYMGLFTIESKNK